VDRSTDDFKPQSAQIQPPDDGCSTCRPNTITCQSAQLRLRQWLRSGPLRLKPSFLGQVERGLVVREDLPPQACGPRVRAPLIATRTSVQARRCGVAATLQATARVTVRGLLGEVTLTGTIVLTGVRYELLEHEHTKSGITEAYALRITVDEVAKTLSSTSPFSGAPRRDSMFACNHRGRGRRPRSGARDTSAAVPVRRYHDRRP
jgi:hypothetical protein